MKNKHKTSIIFLIICITGCLPLIEKWDDKITIARYDRASKAYYDKETPEQKALRKINRKICDEISLRSENRIPRAGYPNGVQNDIMYRDCMEERGSPLFSRKNRNHSKNTYNNPSQLKLVIPTNKEKGDVFDENPY